MTLAVVTFLIRPFLMLLVGLGLGYGIGFTDAFRNSDTLGDKASRVVYRFRPEAVNAGVHARSSVIRDTILKKAGVTGAIDSIPPF